MIEELELVRSERPEGPEADGGCMEKLDRLGWVAQRTYGIEDVVIGVRTTSIAFARWMDSVLGHYRAPGAFEPYLSVVVGNTDNNGRATRDVHLLYRGTELAVRTRRLTTLGRALLAQLDSVFAHDRADAIYAELGVAALNGSKALVPPTLTAYLSGLGGQVEKAGLKLPGEHVVALDPASGDVLPSVRRLRVPDDALQRLGSNGDLATPDRLFVEQPMSVDAIFALGWEGPVFLERLSPAAAMYHVGATVLNMKALGPSALLPLERLIRKAPTYEVGALDRRGMLQGIVSALCNGAAR